MEEHDCQDLPPARAPQGTRKSIEDYDLIEHVMVDLVKMEDGRWLVSFGAWARTEERDMREIHPQAVFVTNPPSYIRPDCDADVAIAADLTANVLMHQAKAHYDGTQGGRYTTEVRKHM